MEGYGGRSEASRAYEARPRLCHTVSDWRRHSRGLRTDWDRRARIGRQIGGGNGLGCGQLQVGGWLSSTDGVKEIGVSNVAGMRVYQPRTHLLAWWASWHIVFGGVLVGASLRSDWPYRDVSGTASHARVVWSLLVEPSAPLAGFIGRMVGCISSGGKAGRGWRSYGQ
jgi:hypothetical protein